MVDYRFLRTSNFLVLGTYFGTQLKLSCTCTIHSVVRSTVPNSNRSINNPFLGVSSLLAIFNITKNCKGRVRVYPEFIRNSPAHSRGSEERKTAGYFI